MMIWDELEMTFVHDGGIKYAVLLTDQHDMT